MSNSPTNILIVVGNSNIFDFISPFSFFLLSLYYFYFFLYKLLCVSLNVPIIKMYVFPINCQLQLLHYAIILCIKELWSVCISK